MVAVRLLLQARDELTAQLLLDTAVAEYALSLSKVFTDKQQILKRGAQRDPPTLPSS